MRRNSILIIILFYPLITFSQLRSTRWHFGNTAKGLYFDSNNSFNLSVTNNSYTPYGWAGSSVSTNDETGNLNFYTDGKVVVDKNNLVMPNGNSLNGAISTGNNGAICMNPGSCDQWYVFSISTSWETQTVGNLYYSIVDMSLSGNGTINLPNGDVVQNFKNVLVTEDVTEGLEIIPKPNSHNFWLIIANMTGANLAIYEISPNGISFTGNQPLGNAIDNVSILRYSEATRKLAIVSLTENQPVLTMDFDASVGTFSNINNLQGTPIGSGSLPFAGIIDAEFSVDGSKLYLSKLRGGTPSTGGKLYQYDFNLSSNNLSLIYDVSPSSSQSVALGVQRGPDDKIYFIHTNLNGGSRFISVVDEPNNSGANCNFLAESVDLGSNVSQMNLFPKFHSYINTLPLLTDSILFYQTYIPDTLNYNLMQGQGDNEGDNINFAIISSSGGTATVQGSNLRFIKNGLGEAGIVELVYCDDFCYSSCDTLRISIDAALEISLSILEENHLITKVFPNPASSKIIVECDPTIISSIQILDVNGRIINEIVPDSDQIEIEISDIRLGLYFVDFKGYQGQSLGLKKMIKQSY